MIFARYGVLGLAGFVNILFVCLGNICRSPLAAGIMKAIHAELQIEGLVESAGTADWNVGSPADHRSIKVAAEAGIDITAHRARQICAADFEHFDVIYVMDRDNERALLSIAPSVARRKIRLICASAADAAGPTGTSAYCEIPDPYHGELSHFREIFHLLNERCRLVAGEIESGERHGTPNPDGTGFSIP